jgi:hypothetical protein
VGQSPTTDLYEYTTEDVQKFSAVQFGGPPLVAFDQTGNNAVLPSNGPKETKELMFHVRAMLQWLTERSFTQETDQALGTFTEYLWEYADVSADPGFLPWSVVSGRRPVDDRQIILWVDGQLVKDYLVSATGISLGTGLTSGQSAFATVVSSALASAHTDLVYRGVTGSGVGHKTWAIHNLDLDIYGTSPSVPTSTTKAWVFLNGMRRLPAVGVTITVGSGTCTVTFIEDVPGFEVQDDDYVTFIVWRA